jgi:hypothetical protein
MQLSRIPIPLIIAAVVATTAVVIYLNLSVVSVPVVADANFSSVLVAGSPYLWRGAGAEITVSSNATIWLSHMPVFHVVHANGPIGNVSLGADKWLVHLRCRTFLVERFTVPGGGTYQYLIKLVNTSVVSGLTVYVPRPFSPSETITEDDANAIGAITGVRGGLRVVNIHTNGTHIAIDVLPHNSTSSPATHYYRLPPPVSTREARVTSRGFGVSYTVGSTTVSAYIMPYHHIVIVPNATARVTITAR